MGSSKTFYAFRDKRNGDLVRVDQGDEFRLARTDRFECPVFEATSSEQLANVLVDDTPSYNTSAELPSWGPFQAADLEPVKVTVTVDAQPVPIPERVEFKTIEVREIHGKLACSYAGHEVKPAPGWSGLVFWLIELPKGETLVSARRWVGQVASPARDRWTKRHVYALVTVPDEYVPLTTGKGACALCIASGAG